MQAYVVNYMELPSPFWGRKLYLVVDTWQEHSEFFFELGRIRAVQKHCFDFERKYKLMVYAVRNREERRFLAALKKIEEIITLSGDTEYQEDCKKILEKFKDYVWQPKEVKARWYHKLLYMLWLGE